MSNPTPVSRAAQWIKTCYAEIFLLSWLLLPNIAQWLTTNASLPHLLASLLVSLCFLLLPSIIVNSRRALFLANAPWAFFSGFLASYIIYYHAPISSGMMQSVLQTDWREAHEQLNRYIYPALISLAAFAVYILLAWRLNAAPLKNRKILMASGLWGITGLIYLPYAGFEAYERLEVTLDTHFYREAYPVNILDSGYEAIRKNRTIKNRNFKLPAIHSLSGTEQKIFVLIAGESTRAQSFDEVGRDLDFFSQYPGLIYFNDVLAQANFTNASIPMLLTGATTLQEVADRPNLIDWQNSAGCVTAVISNNTSYDFSDNAAISDIAGDSGITHHSRYDHDMLPTVDGLLATTATRNLCIILHMAGSHFDYSARYRDEFEHYPVSGDEQEKLLASYQNSVVMVQDFLGRLIDRLSNVEGQAFMVYTSDHGENLMEIEGLKEHVTLRPTEYELKVPMLYWANKQYREEHQVAWQQLANNSKLPVSNASVLATLLDAMGFPGSTLEPGKSLMGRFIPTERFFVHPSYSLRSEKSLLRDNSHNIELVARTIKQH